MASSKPVLQIDVITLFPSMFDALRESIPGRALADGSVVLRLHSPREETDDPHRTVDDAPYGGGGGMILKVEPIVRSVEKIKHVYGDGEVILLSPQGALLRQQIVEELAERLHWIVICGHYKGIDERIRTHVVDREISVGDYVVSGGELPAMMLIDAAVRLRPGAVGNPQTVRTDSHTTGLLDHPWYTRPEVFRGWEVPKVLLSGNHEAIATWRRQQRLLVTLKKRPELLIPAQLSDQDRVFLREQGWAAESSIRAL